MRGTRLLRACAVAMLLVALPIPAFGWSNGGTGAAYGTHDWCVQEAAILASENGSGWLDVDIAMAASSDPDFVLKDTYSHIYDIWGSPYGNAPTRIAEVWDQVVAARDAGHYSEASRLLGIMSHYYTDVCNPLHTDQNADEDSMHSSYESAVSLQTNSGRENSAWIVADGLTEVTDPAAITVDAAVAGHPDHASLVSGYLSGGTAAVAPITERSLNRAVNGLADMIDTLEGEQPLDNGGDTTQKFTRIAGNSRFDVCVAMVRAGFPRWEGITDVVVASGDDRAAADPLAAGSLCWVYDAPLLLVSANSVPASVMAALVEIENRNPGVKVHVVGGPGSVPAARLTQIAAVVGSENVERLPYGDRFATAANIAERVRQVAPERGKTVPSVALVANGADSNTFFDALALSAISARIGAPILLVRRDAVPPATAAELVQSEPAKVYVAGGSGTVSESVQTQLGALRWSGRTRYDTACFIASQAISNGWLSNSKVGIASKLPDALTGGSFIGRQGGPLLFNAPTTLTPATGSFVHGSASELTQGYVFGGTGSLSEGNRAEFNHLADPDYVVPPALATVGAFVSDPSPHGGAVTVYVDAQDQLGNPIEGATVNTTWHYKTTTPSQGTVTGSDGIAQVTRSIGSATPGYKVIITCTVSYAGKSKTVSTSFTPR